MNTCYDTSSAPDFERDLDFACSVLSRGGIIVYPTDTIWGIGCDATNERAVERIYHVKRRDDSKAMILLVADLKMLSETVADDLSAARCFLSSAARPTTVIYNHPKTVARNLLAADGSVAVRVTREAFSSELCRRFGRPIVSTSANISGAPAPRNFADIDDEILNSVDFVVNCRRNETAVVSPSAIVKLNPSAPDGVTYIRK